MIPMAICFHPETIEELREMANIQGISISAMVRQIVEECLAE